MSWEGSAVVASPMIQSVLKSMEGRPLWDRRLPSMIQDYFADMAVIFREAKRNVRRGGESVDSDRNIRVRRGPKSRLISFLADVASRGGWNLENVFVLRRLSGGRSAFREVHCRTAAIPPRVMVIILKRP